ncbi:pectinesterase family protein [Butyrivibrio fibrisolvens]|uniref:pectinesterase family protein n=1 Tax=Butyrivibrio fibrisolvens TaxID=831 RepID=UPI000481794C|nr:pectinesterase family protein [Butyrivibrio fibrisolvens]
MKKNSSSKRVQSFILAALLSMTLLGGNVVTSMAQENDQQTETTNTQAVPADNTSGNVTDPEAEKGSSDTGSGIGDTTNDQAGRSNGSDDNASNGDTSITADDAADDKASDSNNDEAADKINSDESESDKSNSDKDKNANNSAKEAKTSDNTADDAANEIPVDVSKADYTSWDFSTNGINQTVQYGSSVDVDHLLYNNLYIDTTTAGKYAPNGASWGQFNAGTVLYFAVPANSVITILAYENNYNLELSIAGDGADSDITSAEITGANHQFTYTYEYSGNQAALVKLTINDDNTYLRSLSISEKAAAEPEITEPEEEDYSKLFSYPVKNSSWDFTEYDAESYVKYEGKTGSYKELYINASTGKFEPRENGSKDDAIVNDTTLIVVPFNRAGTLKVTYYDKGSSFLADGETKLLSGDTYEYTGKGYGYVTLLATGQIFLYSIEIEYPKSALDDKGNGDISVWDFGGQASGIEGATDMISTKDIENISSIGSYTDSKGNTKTSSVTSNTSVSFGDLTLYMGKGDRFYTATSIEGKTYQATNKKGIYSFDDYTSSGYYYGNGKTSIKKGAPTSRYITIANVEQGDTFTLYMGVKFSSSATATTETAHFKSADGSQDETFTLNAGSPASYTFTATTSGTYTIYAENTNGGKPDFYRIVKGNKSQSVLSGSINFEDGQSLSDDMKLLFTCTDDESVGSVYADIDYNNDRYAVYLKNGHSYSISIVGPVGYDVSDSTNTVASGTSTHDITIIKASTVAISGTVTGIDEEYIEKNKSQITFTDSKDNKVSVTLAKDGSYEGINVIPGIEYTVSLTDCPDYEIAADNKITVSEDDELSGYDFVATLINSYKVTGKFIGLTADADLGTLTFVNTKDKAEYEATVLADNAGYEVSLRDGTYKVKVSNTKYTTSTTVTVAGEDTTRDLYFGKKKSDITVGDADRVYVGYTDDRDYNFDTVQEAIDAITNTRTGDHRVVVQINAGTYREQVVINTPNVTLLADGDVKLTWYYGIGYTYYSAKNGYYDEEAAYNQTSKGTVTKWGASTYVKKNATGFKASGITFENSFNLYMTEEELEDGVTLNAAAYGDSKTSFERKEGADVTCVAATERATALAIEAADAEFYNVTVLGSQDTLYTGPGTRGYFIDSKISGNTDYIFGYGDWAFKNCELHFEGYSDGAKKHSYITAARGEGSTYGYLFENCTITGPNTTTTSDVSDPFIAESKVAVSNSGKTLGASYLGRPWDTKTMVTFSNTTISRGVTIHKDGWFKMSGREPYTVTYREFNTYDSNTLEVVKERKTADGTNNISTIYEKIEDLEELGLTFAGYTKLLGWEPTLTSVSIVTPEPKPVVDPENDPSDDPANANTGASNESSTGSTEASNESSTGSTEASNESSTGSTEASNESSTRSTKAYNESSTGSTEASNESSTGSTEASNESSTGSTEASNESSTGSTEGSTGSTNESSTGSTDASGSNSSNTAVAGNTNTSGNAAGTGSTSATQTASNTASEGSASTTQNNNETSNVENSPASTNESAVLGASRDQETATVNTSVTPSEDGTSASNSDSSISGRRLASTGDSSSIAAHLAIIMLACCMVIFIIEMQEREEKA